MNLVFISSPYRGDVKKNIENAKHYCTRADIKCIVPIAPHLYFTTFLDDNSFLGRADGMAMGKTLMKYCKEMWIFCNELTEGMIEEIAEAKKLGLPMKFYTPEMEELNRDNYIIHPELGPGYRRLIAEAFGDRFTYEPGCSGDCSKCPCHKADSTGGESAAGSTEVADRAETAVEVRSTDTGSKPVSFWNRIFHRR